MSATSAGKTIRPPVRRETINRNQFANVPASIRNPHLDRPRMDADIVCVGFGPATAGFLSTLSKQLLNADGTPAVESAVAPGLPPQVLCYERADDLGFGVSGVVTKARALRASFPDIDKAGIPMAAPVGEEKVLYLLDPVGASRRSALLRLADKAIRACQWALPFERDALNLPWTPGFLHKHGGMVLSHGTIHAMGRRAGAKHGRRPNLARHARLPGAH